MAKIKKGKIIVVVGFSLATLGLFWCVVNFLLWKFFLVYGQKSAALGPVCLFLGSAMVLFPGRGDVVDLELLSTHDVVAALKKVPWLSYVMWILCAVAGIVIAYYFKNFLVGDTILQG